MPPSVACPSCKISLKLPVGFSGKAVKCPRCSTVVPVSAAAPARTAPAKPEAVKPAAKAAPAAQAPVKKVAAKKPAPDEEEVIVDEAVDEDEEVIDEADDEEPAERASFGLELVEPGTDPFEDMNLPEKMLKGLRKEISKKEKVIWVGRPSVEIQLHRAWIAVPVGLLFACIGIGLIVTPFMMEKSETVLNIVLPIMGVIFAGVGGLAASARIFIRKWSHARAVYILTDKRVVLHEGGRIRSYEPKHLARKMERKPSSRFKGAGDLIFAVEKMETRQGGSFDPSRGEMAGMPIGFLSIEKVREVEKLIRATLIDKLLEDQVGEDEDEED